MARLRVIEVDRTLAEHAAYLTLNLKLASSDSIHLAAALVRPPDDPILATWDDRLHPAAGIVGLGRVPAVLDGNSAD